MNLYKVMLADDHVMFREGIRRIIEDIEGVAISGEANDGIELLAHLKKSRPDLVILDISMPNFQELETIREIKKLHPHVKVVVLTMHRKKECIRQALMNGADGFLLKKDTSYQLIRAVQAVRSGEKYLSPLIVDGLIGLVVAEEQTELLTKREREILNLLVDGKQNQEIAEVLLISPNTVRRHRYNIMEKLNLKGTADLVKYTVSQHYLHAYS
jgi:DNA-binding NarL/FixJ family response regulator